MVVTGSINLKVKIIFIKKKITRTVMIKETTRALLNKLIVLIVDTANILRDKNKEYSPIAYMLVIIILVRKRGGISE